MREEQIAQAMKVYLSPENKKSVRTVSEEFGIPRSTLQNRLQGTKPITEVWKNNKALSEHQEQLLEGHLIFLAQKKTPLSRMETRILAGKLKCDDFSSGNSQPLSNSWLVGFLSRCKHLKVKQGRYLDVSMVQENGEKFISLFFDLFLYYVNTFNILPDDIWNLDEARFKIGEITEGLQFLVPGDATNVISHDSSELVTALELISRTGKVGKPLLIYKGVHQMLSWFPDNFNQELDSATSPTGFTNEDIFHEWISDHFPSSKNNWSLLLLDGQLTHISERVMATLISRKVIPLFFPSYQTNILQPLDRSCFGKAEILAENEISHNFGTGLNPTKTQFLEAYIRVREQAYSPETIIEGWRRCGLLEDSPDAALIEYRRENPAQVESAIETEADELSTPGTQPKRKMRKRDSNITREQSLLKRIAELEKKNRKLQSSFRQAQRIANEALTLKSITALQATRYKNELEEEKKKHSTD